jgi:transposase
MGLLLHPDTGRRRTLWALIVTLSFSRYQFVWPTFRQTTEAVCEGLDRAWMFFCAIAVTLIPDNTRAMIHDPDAFSPTLVPAFLDYVQARGFFVDPARVRSPKDKRRVENQVPYVRESWFDGEPCAIRHIRSARWAATERRSLRVLEELAPTLAKPSHHACVQIEEQVAEPGV